MERRRQQRLLTLFKIIHGPVPSYLKELVPELILDDSSRNHRYLYTFRLRRSRTELFKRSFIPRTIAEWNSLDLQTRSATCISTFRRLLRTPNLVEPQVIHETNRFASIIFTRIKHRCSSLNEHLHRVNLVPSPQCSCGTGPETTFHFFYDCPIL